MWHEDGGNLRHFLTPTLGWKGGGEGRRKGLHLCGKDKNGGGGKGGVKLWATVGGIPLCVRMQSYLPSSREKGKGGEKDRDFGSANICFFCGRKKRAIRENGGFERFSSPGR